MAVLHLRVGPYSTRSKIELPCHLATTGQILGVIAAQGNEVMIVIPKHGEGTQATSMGGSAEQVVHEALRCKLLKVVSQQGLDEPF